VAGPDRPIRASTWVAAVAYSPDGSRLVSGSGDGVVGVWDAATGEELAMLAGHREAVTAVAYSPDGARIASALSDRTIRVWDARCGAEVAVMRGHERDVNDINRYCSN
jgi:WD40 repeat protein